jgi:hypothetical protein
MPRRQEPESPKAKDRFTEYLQAIDVSYAASERIDALYAFFTDVCSDEITSIFVTDVLGDDGSRKLEHLWLFSGKYMMESRDFLERDDYDMSPIKKRVLYWRMQKAEQAEPTGHVSLAIQFALDTGVSGELTATDANTEYLKDVFVQHVVGNLKE